MILYKGKQQQLLPLLVTDVHTNAHMCVEMYAECIPTHVCAYKCTYKIKADSQRNQMTQTENTGIFIPV